MSEVKYLNNPERGPLFPRPNPSIMTAVTYLGPYILRRDDPTMPYTYWELWVGAAYHGGIGLMAIFGPEPFMHSFGSDETAAYYVSGWDPRPPLGEAYSRAVQFGHIKED